MAETTSQHPSSLPKCYLLVAVNTVFIFVLFGWLAFTRNIDGDEGLYLEAARQVGQGSKLYFDFFFNQMPLSPYFLEGWMKVFGSGLFSGRWLCVVFSGLTGMVTLLYVARRTQNPLAVGFSAFLFYANGMLLAWAPVIKTHPFNIFFLTVSCIVLLEWKSQENKSRWFLVAAGILVGLGVQARLTLAPFPLIYALYVFAISPQKRWGNFLVFSLSAALTSIPTLYYLYPDPSYFFKYVLEFHTKIYPRVADFSFRTKIAHDFFLKPQILFLCILAYLGLLQETRRGWKDFLTSDQLFIWILILAFISIHLMTAMPFTQYFSAMIPFLIMAVIPLFSLLHSFSSAFKFAVLSPIIVFYGLTAFPLIDFELYSIGSKNSSWELKNVETVTSLLKKIVKPGQPCLTWWPGYAVLSGCQSISGMENHMRGHALSEGIPGNTLENYHMMSDEAIIEGLAERRFPWVIDGAYRLETPFSEYTQYVLLENYRLISNVRGVRIYRPKTVPKETNTTLSKKTSFPK